MVVVDRDKAPIDVGTCNERVAVVSPKASGVSMKESSREARGFFTLETSMRKSCNACRAKKRKCDGVHPCRWRVIVVVLFSNFTVNIYHSSLF